MDLIYGGERARDIYCPDGDSYQSAVNIATVEHTQSNNAFN